MKIRVRYRHWFPRLLGVSAITLYPYILTAQGPNHWAMWTVLKHELSHVADVRRMGWFRFYWTYIAQYLDGLWAGKSHEATYADIQTERDAYAVEGEPLTMEEKHEVGLA